MRPVSLQLEGFGGFRSPTSIDFEDLDLIALVGKTGAGKSTVIDAITFALYGMVARYDDARKVHPVINALSTEANVQFVFESGDRRYIASRVLRRTKSGASTKEARLQQDETVVADGAKEVTAAVEGVVGLDFGQFTKVVVLPQGRFSAFLRDSAKDRRKMLTETLGLDHYEALGKRAREIAKEARVSADEKRTALDRFDVAAADLSTLDGQISELTDLHTLISSQAADVQAAETSRSVLVKAQAECEAWIDQLGQVQLPTDVADVGQEIEASKVELASAAEAVKVASRRWEEAMASVKAGPDENQCRRALADHEAHESFTSQLAAVQAELDNENKRLREATEEMAGFDEKAELFDRELAEAEQAERDLRQHIESDPSSDSLRRLQAQSETLRNVGDQLTSHEADVTTASEVVAQAEHEVRTAEAVVENVDRAHRQAAVSVDGEALRSKLVVGEPCPVCMTTVENIPVVGNEPQNLDDHGLVAAQEDLKNCRSKLEAARLEKTKQETLRTSAQQSLEDLSAALESAPDDEEIAAQLLANEKRRRALADATQHREELATTARQYRHSDGYAHAELRVKQANVRTHKLEKKEMALAAQHDALASRLADAASPEALLASIDVAQGLRHDEEAEEKRRAEALGHEASMGETLAVAEATAGKLRSAFTGVRDRVADLTPPAPGTTSLLEDWKILVDWASGELAEQRQKAAGLADEIRSADHHISQHVSLVVNALDAAAVLQLQSGDRLTIDPSVPARSLSQAEHSIVRLLAATEGRRSAVSQQLEQAVGLRTELAEVKERHRVYELLGNELKASNFQDWILSEIVAALAARGSDRLYELSSGQFSLDADELDFVVVDHTNGDTRRDAKTLSGGETFLASLALALALADGIVDMSTRIANPVESLFLDEGFGTLDGDYLDVVASAVEELGAQGRMVVVITHIDELAERMPTRFELVKTQGTSAIERVDA